MAFVQSLEKRFGRYAIPNLTLVIIAGQALLYFAVLLRGGENALDKVTLVTPLVLDGEVWRLLTFVFMPPVSDLLFALIAWYLMYLFGSTLEQVWGSFRFNLFLLVSYLAHVVAAFVVWYGWGIARPVVPGGIIGGIASGNFLLYGTLFLAFARIHPNMTIHLFFVLPIKIRWIALVAWLGYAYSLAILAAPSRILLFASLLNYFLFFGREHVREWKQGHRKKAFQKVVRQDKQTSRHECVVCGATSEMAPRMLFRYCSKCEGQCGYCPEHIHNHEHRVG